MSVRGSKNKIILYVAGIFSIVFVIFLYHNASQKLEEMEKLYERCHLNEESLSAQLQGMKISFGRPERSASSLSIRALKSATINLEYKVRLEKSLQQEKSEHSQIKDDMQNKLEEERQTRERENLESINKFTALQQKYKFLLSQHENANLECNKLRQLHLSELEEKGRLQTQVQSLKSELKLVKENKDNDIRRLKEKNSELQNENAALKANKIKMMNSLSSVNKYIPLGAQIKLPERVPLSPSAHKAEGELKNLQHPELIKLNASSTKSPTSANKPEQELFPSAHNVFSNTSTPMINPDAVLSLDKIPNAAPVPQPRQESYQNFQFFENKENVGAKPEELARQGVNDEAVVQGVLRAPDIINDFIYVPAIQQYKGKMMKQGIERNNNGGEVGDEGEPLNKNPEKKEKRAWREGEVDGLLVARNSAGNNLSKNDLYQYQAEYEGKKEEGEDDDDVDPMDYQHVNEKNHQQQERKPNVGAHVKIPLEDKRENVMLQPK